MPILEDTRQQVHHGDKHANKHRWWESHGVEIERIKLDFGDYAYKGSNVVVDTKRSLDEVAQNVGRDHDRFVRELDKAREAGCRLIILVEIGGPYKSLDDVSRWYPQPCRKCPMRGSACEPRSGGRCKKFKRKPMQGPTVLSIMRTLERDHGCRFELCHPAHSAQRICELLGVSWT